ncbi:permease [Clostridium sp. DMHC 10]|uniref:AI-2E family transporter n=1 Tax=Clostridium sp. DMHC 10 TaxID=747377 RepID=UPI00069D414A|nr:AI-2E family transporter [Clostridium sp. DMHC 10]KOF56695.1 permease [Clostridium sp. DMHC 10]
MEKYKKLIQCAFLLAVFIVLTLIIKHYFKPFFVMFFLIILCTPIYNFLCKINIFNNKINAVISIAFVNTMIFMFFIYIGNFIIKEIGINAINNFSSVDFNKMYFIKDADIAAIFEKIKIQITSFFNSDFIRRGAIYTTDSILAYFVGNIGVYFILTDKYDIVSLSKIVLPDSNIQLIYKKIGELKKIIAVEISLVIITTVETVIGLLILGVDNAVIFGLLCGVLDILPYVGTILVFLPLVLYKIYLKNYIIAFGILALYILLQVNRQILETKFMSSRLKVHPLLILISLYIGMKLFGVIGIFMGPLYVISAKEIIFSV